MSSHYGKVREFLDMASKGDLYASKCPKCGRLYFPPRSDCSDCASSGFEWVKLNGRGRLLTYTSVEVAPESFKQFAPYVIAVAALDEGPKMMGWLTGIRYEDAKIGMMVMVRPRLEDGHIRFEFQPY